MKKKLLAADIGGTHARFMAFENLEGKGGIQYASKDFPSFESLMHQVLKDKPDYFDSRVGCFAFPGIEVEGGFKVTHLPWQIDRKCVAEEFNFKELYFLNDLQASAYGIQVLPEESFHTLQQGKKEEGNLAILSPGTGLGEAFLSPLGESFHTEGGHADFAPIDSTQMELWKFLQKHLGRVSYENILSGCGMGYIYDFLAGQDFKPCIPREEGNRGLAICQEALSSVGICRDAVQLFLNCLAQEAGNLALHTLAKKGVYIGGGIIQNILPLISKEIFMNRFDQKGPMRDLLQSIPVKVLLDQRSSLFGCAWYCLYGNR